MKILSIDTASNICGVSILEDTNLICKLDSNTGRTHSENLMPMIKTAFEKSNLSLNDIDLLVCNKGPGSFTGIRIGIATIKAFHDSLDINCIGISSLESLAYLVKNEGLIFSIIDCKNDNCYFALYELKNSEYHEIVPPSTDNIYNAINICNNYISNKNLITVVGDGVNTYKDIIIDNFKGINLEFSKKNDLDSYSLALAGINKFKINSSEEILPLYLKKPQAQRQLESKLKNIEISNMEINHLDFISKNLKSDFDSFWNISILKDELNSETSKYIVAKLNDEIIGFAGIKIMIDEADIMNIVVKKDYRNQGIGSMLLKTLIDLSKDLNCINLEVMEENYPAIHLYKKFGFKQCGIRKNYYKDKNGIIMKRLT